MVFDHGFYIIPSIEPKFILINIVQFYSLKDFYIFQNVMFILNSSRFIPTIVEVLLLLYNTKHKLKLIKK